jgi:uncharacterized surface protein with fasciclin (FAS1) repeats
MKKLLFSMFLALSAVLTFTACDDDETTPKSITELAATNTDLSSLVAALTRAELVSTLNGTGPFTVFAPTNAAFATFLAGKKLEDIPKETLKQVLLNHVVSGEVKSGAIQTGYAKSLATFGNTQSNLSLYLVKDAAGVSVNKAVKVSTADVAASNGVIHIVDKVIELPTIVSHALNNPNFSTLVAALTRADLGVNYVQILSGTGPFTVFAPTNDAFKALLDELKVKELKDIDAATLNAVLQFHVVKDANVLSTTLTNNQEVTTFAGKKFKVTTTGGAKITDGKNRIANIVAVDVQGTNGVVHAIDKVILPN